MPGVGRVVRIIWSAGSQGLSSVSNLVLSVAAARATGIEEFGAFGIAYTVYQFGLGSSRAFIGEPALVRGGDARGILGASFTVGFVGALVCLLVWGVYPGQLPALLIMALGFPLLMIVDAARYFCFSQSSPQGAVVIDAIWLVVQVSAAVALEAVGALTLITVMASWLLAALVALAWFLLRQRCWPSLRAGLAWTRGVQDISFRFWGEYLTFNGVTQTTVYSCVFFWGLAASAAIRAAQVVVGPLNMVTMGVAVVVLPALAGRWRTASGRDGYVRSGIMISATLLAASTGYGLLAFLMPDAWGTALLGESWSVGASLLPLTIATLLVGNLSYGASAGLRAMGAARESLRIRVLTVPGVLLLVLLGASHSTAGALAGVAIGGGVQAVIWWVVFVRLVRSRRHTDPTEGGSTAPS